MSDLDGALSVQSAADLYDVSPDVIRAAYRSGLLQVRYAGTKVLIGRAELRAWFEALPTERVSA